jgi:hypothetical protein
MHHSFLFLLFPLNFTPFLILVPTLFYYYFKNLFLLLSYRLLILKTCLLNKSIYIY